MAASISMEEYHEYRDQYVGFCTACQAWTGECVEPDAREYECPECGESKVYGVEEALMLELIELA